MFTRAVINNNEQIESRYNYSAMAWKFTQPKCNLNFAFSKEGLWEGQHKGNSFVLQAKNRKVEDADAAAFAISRMPKSSTQPMVVVKSK